MKRSGRASIVFLVAAVLVAAAVIFLFVLAGESPSGVAGKFLTALAKGDSKTLSKLSFIDGVSDTDLEKKWEETHENAKYWQFGYAINETKEQDADNATVVLQWVKNSADSNAYPEKYELPMVRKDGKWKVDVRGISREMYPGLPR